MNLVEKAREFAIAAHDGQTRRVSLQPYFVHTEAVAMILKEAGLSPEVIAAGYLHDTVEDTSVTIEKIKSEFGETVAELVAGNTEDKTKTWEERKAHTIEVVKTAIFEVKCLVAADKLDNIKSIIEEANLNNQQDIWVHFKRGKEKQAWYYQSIAQALFENLEESQIPAYFFAYKRLVEDLFN